MTSKPTIEDCMEQAQIFASAWSRVGSGVFGTTMEQATAEKEELEAMLHAALAAPAQPEAVGEPVFAFRRKGLDDFCTCTGKRYAELSLKPNLFETRIFYTAPQPAAQAQPADEKDSECEAPPIGWRCTRTRGHDGPCAAVESPEEKAFVERGMRRIRDAEDAGRYRLLKHGQHWSVIDWAGNTLRADALDAAVDHAIAAQKGDAA